jgi:hypothetical protein
MIVAGVLITTTAVALVVLLIILVLMHVVGRIGVGLRSAVVFGAIVAALLMRIEVESPRGIFFEPESVDAYHRILERNIAMTARKEWYAGDLPGGRGLVFSSSAAMPEYGSPLFEAYLENEIMGRSRAEFIDGERSPVRQRFLESQAALNILEEYPLIGIGPGNYQRFIGHHYRTVPRINTLEPSMQNGYLVLASTTGILGFSCFVWMLLFLLNAAWAGIRTAASEADRISALALFGALVSFTLVNLFFDAAANHATLILLVIVAALVTIRRGSAAASMQRLEFSRPNPPSSTNVRGARTE